MKMRNKPFIEIELGNRARKVFLKIDPDTSKIWIDTEGLPHAAILCAMCDSAECIYALCGAKSQYERYFLDIEWAINEWGGDEEIINALKKRKQMTLDALPKLKEKYVSELKNEI